MGTTATWSLPYPASTDAPNGASQIQSLAVAVDSAITSATNTQFVQPLFARKATDEGRVSTITLANDTSLVVSGLIAGAIYEVSMTLLYNGGSGASEGDIQWTFSQPSGSSGAYSRIGDNLSGTLAGAFPFNWTDTVVATTSGVSTSKCQTLRGLLVCGSAGSLQFKWAQNTSSGTNTHVLSNSYLTARRVA